MTFTISQIALQIIAFLVGWNLAIWAAVGTLLLIRLLRKQVF